MDRSCPGAAGADRGDFGPGPRLAMPGAVEGGRGSDQEGRGLEPAAGGQGADRRREEAPRRVEEAPQRGQRQDRPRQLHVEGQGRAGPGGSGGHPRVALTRCRAAALLSTAALTLCVAGVTRAAEPGITLQEVILRAKPATVLVVSEVASEVTVDCGAGSRTVTPPPFRETGTGWFVESNGWVVTNAHVVQPAHQPPRWVTADQARKGVVAACVSEALARQNIAPGDRPDLEDQMKQEALARALPGATVELKPSIFVLLSNGFRLP